MIRLRSVAPGLLALLLLLGGCGGAGPGPEQDAGSSDRAAEDDSGCAQVDAPAAKPDGGQTKPNTNLDAAKENTITFATSCGTFIVTLDVEAAPRTSASMASLARSGFYDNTIFHRIVPGFVIQGGDPTASGSGGPGYDTVDKPPADAKYTRGVVAMAKTATEAPGTSGSQFFVVTAPDSGLPPEYAVVGKVTRGMDAVKRIESLGSASEQPSRPVVLEKATFAAR